METKFERLEKLKTLMSDYESYELMFDKCMESNGTIGNFEEIQAFGINTGLAIEQVRSDIQKDIEGVIEFLREHRKLFYKFPKKHFNEKEVAILMENYSYYSQKGHKIPKTMTNPCKIFKEQEVENIMAD